MVTSLAGHFPARYITIMDVMYCLMLVETLIPVFQLCREAPTCAELSNFLYLSFDLPEEVLL